MTKVQKIFFALLRSGLSGDQISLVTYGKISPKEWLEVYELFAGQRLTGVGFSGVEKLDRSEMPDIDTLMEWLGQTEYIKTQNNRYRRNAKEFIDLISVSFSAVAMKVAKPSCKFLASSPFVFVLKGMDCARWYREPDRRALGDLDVVCLADMQGGFKGFQEVSESFNVFGLRIVDGYNLCNEACLTNGLNVEYHDYKHSKIHYETLDIENHLHLMECRGFKERQEAERYLKELLVKQCSDSAEQSGKTKTPSAQFNALFLTIHAFIHFLEEGIIMRHVCDWAMFVREYQGVVNWKEARAWTDRLGMTRFMDGMNWMTENLLGVKLQPELSGEGKEVGLLLLDDMMNGNKRKIDAGLSDVKYQWEKTKNMFRDTWKFKRVYGRNVLWYYLKFCWGFVFDRSPKVV